MAILKVRELGDEVLRSVAKPVNEMTPKIKEAISDMFETMYEYYGVGLAAPQVGIRKRMFVVDVPIDDKTSQKYVAINPQILETSGSEAGIEGCLSVPGKQGTVTRPTYVKMRAQDENMEFYEVEAQGLLARALLHEYDHLDGIIYVDKIEGPLEDCEEN